MVTAREALPSAEPAPAPSPARAATGPGAGPPVALLLVVGAYLASALVVPTGVDALVGDDWVYVRSVETLLREGRLHVLDLAVVTLVLQTFWGALFAALLGPGFGVLRFSTVVVTALAGAAVYGTCRELGADRGWSALGAAAYLFNPLLYVLSFSFMTDPHFAAWLAIATWGHARALRPGAPPRWLWLASLGTAAAFLVRQQGALIVPAVLLALWWSGRLRPDRAGLLTAVRVCLLPALAMAGYYAFLFLVNGVPEQQESFLRKMATAGVGGTAQLVGRLFFIALAYLGFLALPTVAAGLPALGEAARGLSRRGWLGVAAWAAVLAVGVARFRWPAAPKPPMPFWPYIPQYLGPSGLGPTDLRGGRPWLVPGEGALAWLTLACCLASLAYGVLLLGRMTGPGRAAVGPGPTRAAAGLVLSVGAWQWLGVLPPSFHFRTWIISVDRYLLPLLPAAVCLGVWAVAGLPARRPGAWLATLATAAWVWLAVAGTHDFLAFQGATWDMAREAVRMGVPLDKLDAGASWDGYHLYEPSIAQGIKTRTKGGPWWTDLFAPATDSTYIVTSGPVEGYDLLYQLPYRTWWQGEQMLYLGRRQGAPGPP